MSHTLFLIPTPIGNLEDITIRAIKQLWSVDVIFAEDTREAHRLLRAYQEHKIKDHLPQLISLTDYNEENKIGEVLSFLTTGKDVALISDRGTPLISDPGFKIVRQVIKYSKNNPIIKLVALPGPNALLPSLQLSGLSPVPFYYVGFLPKKPQARKNLLQKLPETTIIAYESPYRLNQTLIDIAEVLQEGNIAVCRELTKIHEEVIRGTFIEVVNHFKIHPPKGELTLVFRKVAS